MISAVEIQSRIRQIAIIGNPNSGKTTLFNALTGLRQKVGNYPGVTVEKKEGQLCFHDGTEAVLVDLPGTYSFTPSSPDEQIATDILLGGSRYSNMPDLLICTVDASNLERNLYLVSQIIDRQIPAIVALNMMDVAEESGIRIDPMVLEEELGVQVIPTIGTTGMGIKELKQAIADNRHIPWRIRSWQLPAIVEEELDELVNLLEQRVDFDRPSALLEAVQLLSTNNGHTLHHSPLPPDVLDHVRKDRERLDFMEIDRQSVFVESRYRWIKQVCRAASKTTVRSGIPLNDRIDRLMVHRIWGYVIFLGMMGIVFQSVFTWAALPMEWIGAGFDEVGTVITTLMPPGELRELIVNGGLAGVSAVVTFLPQILFLFFFLGLLEDTGYMSRAAFIMDRLMSKVGLHGKSFVPLLSSFACAIPGIMATRTIENPRDRLVTMLVAPLMSCSARLPVYTLLIAAFVPSTMVLGFLSLSGLVLLVLYLLGMAAALTMAWLFKNTLLKGPPSIFIMELPPYRRPSLRSICLQMWERSKIFLREAGTFILGVSIVLWFLASHPRVEGASPAEQLKHSFAGQAGRLIEPVIKPLGFDWKIGIGLIASVLQREVFVSTMGTVYNIQDSNDDGVSLSLKEHLQQDIDPESGEPSFTLLTALCLMVYYMLAMQCLSTVAIMHRETNGWKWPLIQIAYMTLLAYGATFLVYRAGLLLGIGA